MFLDAISARHAKTTVVLIYVRRSTRQYSSRQHSVATCLNSTTAFCAGAQKDVEN